jgi:hypothetical protein
MAHRDLASRIYVRDAAESGQTRTDVNGRVEMWRGGCRSNISVVRLFRLAVP